MAGSSAGSTLIPFSFGNKDGLEVFFWVKAVSKSENKVD